MNQTKTSIVLALLLAVLFILIPFADDADLMMGIQTAKTFYFAFAMLAIVLIGLILWVVTKKNIIQLKSLDVLLGLYLVYSSLHPFIFSYCIKPVSWIEMCSLTALYLVIRTVGSKQIGILLYAVMVAGIAQAVYGSMQLYGFSHSNHSLFTITGGFFNPGPYAGYLAGIFPIALFYYWAQDELIVTKDRLLTFSGVRDIGLKYIPLVAFISILLVLPASRSRAAWLGAIGGSLMVMWVFRDQWMPKIKFLRSGLSKYSIIGGGLILLLLAVMGMYKFKQGSADGRVLIWKVSGKMVKDKPIWGHGTDQFAAQYMNYQADYFKPNPEVPEAMLADNVVYAYNELLKLMVEKGLLGLILAMLVLASFFFTKTENSNHKSIIWVAKVGLLSICIFGMFAYPSEILPIKIMFVLCMAMMAVNQKIVALFLVSTARKSIYAHKLVYIMLLISILIGVYPIVTILQNQYQAYKSWKDASDIYNVNAYTECLDDFSLAYPLLNNNGDFLVQYGKAFEIAQKPDSAIVLLNEAKQYLNNTILYTALGDSYKAQEQFSQAEVAYLQAWYMVPARFYPLYLLATLYNNTGQSEKAISMAKRVLNKEVKVDSRAVEEIKAEMQNIIEQASLQNRNQFEGKRQEAQLRKQRASCLAPSPKIGKEVR